MNKIVLKMEVESEGKEEWMVTGRIESYIYRFLRKHTRIETSIDASGKQITTATCMLTADDYPIIITSDMFKGDHDEC